jgi:hypothetical protein
MEVKSTISKLKKLVRFAVRVWLIISIPLLLDAQEAKKYFIKNGKMYIELNKRITESALDSFIMQFNLADLGLKQFIRNNFADSLRKMGWNIESNNAVECVISKSLMPLNTDLKNPADKILFTEKQVPIAEMFPATNNGTRYGYNKFRNKDFLLKEDSVVIFFLRNYLNANKVMLAGSFNGWDPNKLAMTKTDSGWIAAVKLGPGKYWYKFITDGKWIVDPDNNLRESDGRGNVNSYYFRPNVLFSLSGFSDARKIYLAGSFNGWNPRDILMQRSGNTWLAALYLPEGTHTYKYVVDGKWYSDEKNPNRYPDEFGGYNSLLQLGKPHLFALKGYENAKRVMLAGSFNSWREDELYMKKTATGWEFPYVLGPGNYEYRFIVDGKRLGDPANPISNANGTSYLIINPNYTFRLKGFNNAQRIYLAGDFNNWNPTAFLMKRQGDEWVFTVNLSRGKQRYKFVVDGNWVLDPGNKLWEQNEHNTGNSIIWVGDNN